MPQVLACLRIIGPKPRQGHSPMKSNTARTAGHSHRLKSDGKAEPAVARGLLRQSWRGHSHYSRHSLPEVAPLETPAPSQAHLSIVSATAANSPRSHCRTLSATAKKPAAVAGFLILVLSVSRRTALFLPATSLSSRRRSFQSTIQTPSSL